MRQYVDVLLTLVRESVAGADLSWRSPFAARLRPSLTASPLVLSVASILAVVAAVWIGLRAWKSGMPVTMKWGVLVVLTVLASPHLLTYDLILLTIPLLVFADWAVANRDDPLQPWVSRLLLLLYLAPFSSNLVRLVPVQLSVVVMVLLVWAIVQVRSLVRSDHGRAVVRSSASQTPRAVDPGATNGLCCGPGVFRPRAAGARAYLAAFRASSSARRERMTVWSPRAIRLWRR